MLATEPYQRHAVGMREPGAIKGGAEGKIMAGDVNTVSRRVADVAQFFLSSCREHAITGRIQR